MSKQIFSSQPYKGTRDFYPLDLQKRSYIFEKWREVLGLNGFSEYETSVIENADLYIAKSGEELGSQQLYNFYDKGERHIALRPEQTPSLARLVANKFGELKFPLRWFSIPNCFRYERPQKGRLREHWQLNVDVIGLEPGAVELELLTLLGKVFMSFGADKKHFKVMFNHRQVLDTWLQKNGMSDFKTKVYKVLDDWFKVDLEENKKLLAEAGLSDTLIQKIVSLTSKDPEVWGEYLEIAKSHPELKLLLDVLPTINPDLEYELNPCIIRGIAYYTGIIFEAFDKNPTNPRALFGGGRYDNLMELFGKSAPAIGFGWGDVTMHEFLENWNLYPDFDSDKNKIGILIMAENEVEFQTKLQILFTKKIPELNKLKTSYDVDYDYSRNENKRYQSLKKRGVSEIIHI